MARIQKALHAGKNKGLYKMDARARIRAAGEVRLQVYTYAQSDDGAAGASLRVMVC